jgi:hypothetical protein
MANGCSVSQEDIEEYLQGLLDRADSFSNKTKKCLKKNGFFNKTSFKYSLKNKFQVIIK